MLTRGADGRLYRVAPNGAVVVAEEAQNQSVSRVQAPRSMDVGASAEIFASSAEIFSAKM
ncbi:hypothetical protein CHU95_01440 [Niveispirillum lacus]|uniref:Uncharacterized protein n=1 Tax=Niveispirillum lacus TaxID=1981099 RepID=A0A255Z8Z8_9PROT|nr:hypothetical protein [Niveispirillum lacus]OYQ37384.1 hypothetical protein CHU95_01440 [Niveispirillum lacus]